MKLLALPIMFLMATPANAITWGEFWEPFRVEQHTYYNYAPRRRRICTREEYREVRDARGHVISYYYDTVQVPCKRRRRYYYEYHY